MSVTISCYETNFHYFRGWDPSFKLHSDDIAGIQGLYGVKEEEDDTDFGGGGVDFKKFS